MLNLKLDNGDFVLDRDSDAFNGQFISFELLPGQSTAIRTVEEVESIFRYVLAWLKRVTERYQKNKKQVKLQLKLKVSRILAGNVEESSTAMSEPMWGSSPFVENGVRKLVAELKRERVLQNGVQYVYFPLRVLIMKLAEPVSFRSLSPDCDEGLINMSKRVRTLLTFKHVGNRFPLEYVMFCSVEYEKMAFCNRKPATSQWRLHGKPSIAFIIDGPTDGMGVDTEGVHWLGEANVIEKFVDKMSRFGAAIAENLDAHRDYDRKIGAQFRNEPNCCICGKPMGIERGHIHHCHRTGRIFGRAHHDCNANYARRQNSLPVFVHCQNADDFGGILLSLFHDRGLKISSKTDKGRQRDEQLTLKLGGLELVFLNAHRFLPDSLQNLKNSIPKTSFKRSNSSYFRGEPVPRPVETTLLLADTIMFVRERIQSKVDLDFCRYQTVKEFILDSTLKMAGINLILPQQFPRTMRPFPGTLETNVFQASEISGTCPIVRALKNYLPFSNFESLSKTELQKFSPKVIAKLANKAPVGYIFHIIVDQENGDGYFVHYILLKYLIKERKLEFTIGEIIKFDQTPFMDSFVSAFLGRSKFHLDRKLGQFFCKNIIENTNMVKPHRVSFKSIPVVEAADFHKQIQQKNFVTANCFAENLVEVVLSEKYKWYEFTFLSLTLRDLIFYYSIKNEN